MSYLFPAAIPMLIFKIVTSIKACDQLLAGKNSLLDSLYQELKSAEDEYVKTLKKQYDDLEIVAQRSEEQYKTMDQAYRHCDDILFVGGTANLKKVHG